MVPEPSYGLSEMRLAALLSQLHDGSIQVPEFQRPFSVDDAWVKALLASVSLGYPIGAVMLLEAGNAEYRFGSRSLAGEATRRPEQFLVDGQRRLTTLYCALTLESGVPVGTARDRVLRSNYLLDAFMAVHPSVDRDAAVRRIFPDARSAPPPPNLFPLWRTFAPDADLQNWRNALATLQGGQAALERFESGPLATLREYRLPVISVPREATRWTIRVRGGEDGPALSDQFRVPPPS